MAYIALTLVVIYQRRTSQWFKRILFSVCVNKTNKNVLKRADNKHENARFLTVFFAMTKHRTVVYDRRAQQGWRTEKRVQFERALIGLHSTVGPLSCGQSSVQTCRPIEENILIRKGRIDRARLASMCCDIWVRARVAKRTMFSSLLRTLSFCRKSIDSHPIFHTDMLTNSLSASFDDSSRIIAAATNTR